MKYYIYICHECGQEVIYNENEIKETTVDHICFLCHGKLRLMDVTIDENEGFTK